MGIESDHGSSQGNPNPDNLSLTDESIDVNAKVETVLADLSQEDAPPPNLPEPEKGESKSCTHHWMIGSPLGGLSHGCCKNCGKERDFDDMRALKYPKLGINTKRAEEAKRRREGKQS